MSHHWQPLGENDTPVVRNCVAPVYSKFLANKQHRVAYRHRDPRNTTTRKPLLLTNCKFCFLTEDSVKLCNLIGRDLQKSQNATYQA
jgi:hypothetical protein